MSFFSGLLIGAGWLCIGLAIAGIFLPLLPTVPLLLLATACFARSSPRWHAWLLDHPRLGPLVADYLEGNGIPLRAKIMAITLLWLSISLSLYLAVPPNWVRLVLLSVAAGVTLYLLRLPNRPKGR
ncbi:MAG: YbaN family protein [Desulfuromonadales bacterium]